jgi:septum formation protein
MLILASASPRRRELLAAAGIRHIVRPASIPEDAKPGEDPVAYVKRVAMEKASAVERSPGDIVLGADTTVCIDGQIFGKPQNATEAQAMLRALSGRDHIVLTGICLLTDNQCVTDVSQTRVYFVRMSDSDIQEYTQSGEPLDKAGAYAIQGLASKFVRKIEGCYHNVVGLPVSLVYSHLANL